jgi:hypothetical protein
LFTGQKTLDKLPDFPLSFDNIQGDYTLCMPLIDFIIIIASAPTGRLGVCAACNSPEEIYQAVDILR